MFCYFLVLIFYSNSWERILPLSMINLNPLFIFVCLEAIFGYAQGLLLILFLGSTSKLYGTVRIKLESDTCKANSLPTFISLVSKFTLLTNTTSLMAYWSVRVPRRLYSSHEVPMLKWPVALSQWHLWTFIGLLSPFFLPNFFPEFSKAITPFNCFKWDAKMNMMWRNTLFNWDKTPGKYFVSEN